MESPSLPSTLFPRRTWRWLFLAYVTLLTIGLLWPKLQIPAVMPRPDLVVHYVSFGLFTLLLCLWNPARTPRLGVNLLVAFAAGAAYGGATELLQAIPILNRSAGWDDWGADVLGVGCGLLAYLAMRKLVRSHSAATPRRADT